LFMEQVRERALEVLEHADLSERGDRLNAGGFVWEMLVEHEHQHDETMLQTLKLAERGTYAPRRRRLPRKPPFGRGPEMVRVEAGPFPLGAGPDGFAYDNERPQHEVELPAFEIDRAPVTAGDFLGFMADGGYARREWWCEEGWAWRKADGIQRPLYWRADGRERSFDRLEPIDPDLPVTHVSWYEADAYARSRGKRLPTEVEWEKAASWEAEAVTKRRYPWGDDPPGPAHANLDQTAFGPAPAGAFPAGASPCGVLGMIGDAWEWTASDFAGYPGFQAFPYPEYSEVFFGDGYKVLRGGSWATRPRVARNTFRNWDLPQRRQIFAGFRCAVDA
jgi:gamma-glutamyl hercynylcysteine S-oxide synthase